MEKELFYYLENSIIQTTCVVISSNNQDSTVVRSISRITNVHLGEVSNSIDDSLFHMHVFSVRLCNFFRAFSSHALSMKITERLSTYHPDKIHHSNEAISSHCVHCYKDYALLVVRNDWGYVYLKVFLNFAFTTRRRTKS